MSSCPTCGQEIIVSSAPISNPPSVHSSALYKNKKGEVAMIASSQDTIDLKNEQDVVIDTWTRVPKSVNAGKSPTIFNPSAPTDPKTNTAETTK